MTRPATSLRSTRRLTALTHALMGCSLLSPALAGAAGPALPSGLQVAHGQASVVTQGAQMTVRNSPNAILNWQNFSIGAGNAVYFDQASASSKVLNRVLGSDPSQILGQLGSNGQVWLLNPNGVLFGRDARVDVGSLVVSTLRLNDNDFLAQRFRFAADGTSAAPLRNEGSLRSSFGGQIALLGAGRVENSGTVDAPGGQINLAAARSIELVDTGLPYLTARVEVPAGEVLNLGRLSAAGGLVDVYAAVVNQQGIVRADSLGTDAQGRVVLRAADTLTLTAGSVTAAEGVDEGKGGRVELLGRQIGVLDGALVEASGQAGGGAIFVGGGVAGADTSLPNAQAVYVGPEARIHVDARRQGDGGQIVLWSNEATRAYGRFSARGGLSGGNGGMLETSGGWLDSRPAALDLTSVGGKPGTWLLDPNNITIRDAAPDQNIAGGPNFTTTNDNSVITTGTIAAALNAGSSVTISTGTAGSNSQAGDILMENATLAVAPGSAVGLTINAARDIKIANSSIVSTGAGLSLDLVSAGSGVGAVEINNSTITTAGGNVRLGGAVANQMPLPDGSFTAAAYRAAVGYDPATAAFASSLSAPRHGILVQDATINAGAGNFSAVGLGAPTASLIANGVRFINASGTTQVSAANVEVDAFGRATNGYGLGIFNATLQATQGMRLYGAGPNRGIYLGGSLALLAAPGSGATMSIEGFGGGGTLAGQAGLLLQPGSGAGWGIRVDNAALTIKGRSLGDAPTPATPMNGSGIYVLGSTGVDPDGVFDFRTATSVNIEGQSLNGTHGVHLLSTAIQGPQSATAPLTITSLAGGVTLESSTLSGAGNLTVSAGSAGAQPGDIQLLDSTLTFAPSAATTSTFTAARNILVRGSTLASSGAALGVSFNSLAPASTLTLQNANITTAGGNVTFGTSQSLCLPTLGCETGIGFDGAVAIRQSAIDAGAGAILGGAASANAALDIDASTLSGRDIELSGRSDSGMALRLNRAQLTASHKLSLDGTTANGTGVAVYSSQVSVNGTEADAALGITGTALNATPSPSRFNLGVLLTDFGSGTPPSLIRAQGASLSISGTGNESGIQLNASGGPGGVVIDAGAGTALTLRGVVADGPADWSIYANQATLVGPAAPAPGTGTVDLVGSGGQVSLNSTTLTAGVPVNIVNDANVTLNATQVTTRGGIALQGVDAGGGDGVNLFGSTLTSSGTGDVIRLAGAVDPVAGVNGVRVHASTLTAAAGTLVLDGQGGSSALDGAGVALSNSTLQARAIDFTASSPTNAGLRIDGSTLRASAGDITMGHLHTVSSTALGDSSTAHWVDGRVSIYGSVLDASAGAIVGGAVTARPSTSTDHSDAFSVGNSTLTARDIKLSGRSDLGFGVVVGQGAQLSATHQLALDGASAATVDGGLGGVLLFEGAQLAVRGSEADAAMTITGRHAPGAAGGGVSLGGNAAAGQITRLTVDGADLVIQGSGPSGGVNTGDFGSGGGTGPAVAIELAGRKAATIGGSGVYLSSTAISGDAASLFIDSTGWNTLANGTTLNFSTGAGTAVTMSASAGSGVDVTNSSIRTGGGNLTFGSARSVCTTLLGCASGTWVDGPLSFTNATLDAGTGTLSGGGVRASGTAAGTFISASTLTARDILLAGRSEAGNGLQTAAGSQMTASHALLLDGVSAGTAAGSRSGVLINEGTQLTARSTEADASLVVQGRGVGATFGEGVRLIGRESGSATQTILTVDGAGLAIQGQGVNGGVLGFGLGSAPGLLIDAAAARVGSTVLVEGGASLATTGTGINISGTQLKGPAVASATGAVKLVCTSGQICTLNNSTMVAQVPFTLMNTAGSVGMASTTVHALGGITVSGASANGRAGWRSVLLSDTLLESAGSGDILRVDGFDSAAAVAAIEARNTTFNAPLGGIAMDGRAGAAGGDGLLLASATLAASTVELRGQARVSGHGVTLQRFSGGAATAISTRDLLINGNGADSSAASTHIGANISEQTRITLSGRGTAQITGDTVAVLDSTFQGDAGALNLTSTGSMLLARSNLDFSAGAGTHMLLTSDSDASLSGRIRLLSTAVKTGGGSFTATGGSGAAVGVHAFDASGAELPRNTVVLEGSNGIFVSASTIDAGSGTVTLSGKGATDGRVPAAGDYGAGLAATGVNSIQAGTIILKGNGGDQGPGIDADAGDATAALNLSARTITVTGKGTGVDFDTSKPSAAVTLGAAASDWAAGSTGVLTVLSEGGHLALGNATLSGGDIRLRTESSLALGTRARLIAGGNVDLAIANPAGVTLGGATDSIDAAALSAALAGTTPSGFVTVKAEGGAPLSVRGALSVPARLRLQADDIALQPGASLASSASGDAVLLAGASGGAQTFVNDAGAAALQTPAGRWVLRLADPRRATLGGLDSAFSIMDVAARPLTVDAAGNINAPLPGSFIAYDLAAQAVSGAVLAGVVDKVYDATTAVTLDPLAWRITGLLPGYTLQLGGATAASMADKNAGLGKAVTLGGTTSFSVLDDGGKPVFGYGTPSFTANVTPATLTLGSLRATDKVYDAGTAASLNASLVGVLGGDPVTLSFTGQFADRNVGAAKSVSYSASLGGAAAGNYALAGASGSTTASITPATLSYVALPVSLPEGATPAGLSGSVTGFIGGDTQASATVGTPLWSTSATLASTVGRYAINGSGLTAANYVFTQDPLNAQALTLTPAPRNNEAARGTQSLMTSSTAAVSVPVAMSTPIEGRVLDAMPAFSFGGSEDNASFRSVNLSQMSRAEMQNLLAARDNYKKKLFADNIFKLEQDPTLADVRPCRSEMELGTGTCLITEGLKREILAAREAAAKAADLVSSKLGKAGSKRKVKQASLPTISRKLALLIGINKYADKRIPELESAVADAGAIKTLLEDNLGYEAVVLTDPGKEAMVRALNQLALQVDGNDSVMIYYAGHGEMLPKAGMGYWLPSDANVVDPQSWISNADIARLVGLMGAKQVMLISDSCYSGVLAGGDKVNVDGGASADDLLSRKAVVIMSSGGNEPVSDEGKDGHSVFAWHLMDKLKTVSAWQAGGSVFDRVRVAVKQEFPQTPQYGASKTAGHEGNTDYLFERRQFEKQE